MLTRHAILAFLLCLGACACWAADLQTTAFLATPTPRAGELLAPRAVLVEPTTRRCYVLDTGAGRVAALATDGTQVGSWSLTSLGCEANAAWPVDPLLPLPALAAGGKTVYLLTVDRPNRQCALAPIDGPGKARTVTLPEGATYGAVALDPAGHLLVAYIRVTEGKAELTLAHEGTDGAVTPLATLADPCSGQAKFLSLTGITVAADGRLAIGIAQAGEAAYSFVRSWLVQGQLREDTLPEGLQTTLRFSLLDGRGKPLDRFRASTVLAGRAGYPSKPCVPLFTTLAFGPQDTVISGGHSLDPFLRVYTADGRVQFAQPRQAIGGQHLATVADDERVELYALTANGGYLERLAPDGSLRGMLGCPLPYDLSAPVAVAADTRSVYVLTRPKSGWRLLRFAPDGRFLWGQVIAPGCAGLEHAQPFLTIPGPDSVLIGWRQPKAVGLSWVDRVMEDGTPGIPLWPEMAPVITPATGPVCPTPLLTGGDGRVYVVRETPPGARLEAYSVTGAFLQQFPPALQGITTVGDDGTLAWARPDDQGLVLARYSPQGAERSWKRLPRAPQDGAFLVARADGLWGWLSATQSLFRLDADLALAGESSLLTPEGTKIDSVLAIAGDGAGRLYLARPGHVYVVE